MIRALEKHKFDYAGATLAIFHANKGEGLPRHEHEYPHATFCASGSCAVRNARGEWVLTKDSQPVNLVENDWHEIEALEDGTVFINVFADGKH